MSTSEFPNGFKLLQDPCIWIGDTRATVDSTPHADGVMVVGTTSSSGRIEGINGNYETVSGTGSIKENIFNNKGVSALKVNLPEVNIVP